ncbi:response regulator [Neobacillus drentensis]|uniref:response regulator n=1 Tax=Neobacillus drentensis TaxID=220684 RepID=UPI002FFDC1E0
MLKAVLFDDEYIVLQGLQKMIDWSKYGIELVGTASNGYEAIDLVETHSPDIVFTDIRMPGMDGLEVVEKVLKAAPEIICVVFSGFNEFEYVKKALKLGVSDYLEKPITIPMIEETIQRILEKFLQKKTVLSFKEKWEDSRIELIEKATLDLLLQGEEALPKWRRNFEKEAKNIVAVTVFALSGKGPDLPSHPSYFSVYIRNGAEHLLVIYHFEDTSAELRDQLLYLMDKNGISIGIGQTYPSLTDASISYKEAIQALRVLLVRRDRKHEAVEKACTYIERNFSKDLTLQDVAEHVGMNPTYFSLLFKEEMKLSYIKYLTKLRMERAKELLQDGNKVGDVSEKVGYHTYRHFSELFRKHVGVNPGQYRDSFTLH